MAGDLVRTQVHDGAPAGLTLDNPPSTREAIRAFLAKSRYSSGRAGEGGRRPDFGKYRRVTRICISRRPIFRIGG